MIEQAAVALYHGARCVALQTLPTTYSGRVVLLDRSDPVPNALGETWRILLPYHAEVTLRTLRLSAGACPERPCSSPVRWLAHGDSITQGARAIAPGLTYVSLVADTLGWDGLNLGLGGSAWGDAVVAEYVASRDDWDVLSIAIGTNTYAASIETAASFRERYGTFLDIVRHRHPTKPVLCITPIWRGSDAVPGEANQLGDTLASYRQAISGLVIARSPSDRNLHLLDGLELIGDSEGLGVDLVHPDARGMMRMAQKIIPALRDLVEVEP